MEFVYYLAASVLVFSCWTITTADQECVEGKYGVNCSLDCGQCESAELCNTTSGVCNGSCQDGWKGVKCDQVQGLRPLLKFAVIMVFVITGSVVVMVAFLLISYCACHRKKQTVLEIDATSDFDKSEDPTLSMRRLDGDGSTREVRNASNVYSWGSEFTKEGDRKNYVNVLAYRKLTDEKTKTDAIYANTLPVPNRGYAKTDHYVNVNP
ncbi:uncharacterized protein LOC121375646 [Gigantopelta aegis]|uniref:uncharacterized protein LOC121375646 n=1 Tax=Gigantopelta aegis TaxID=1735272 RepID=UPI001B88D95B|nr:uncharacterized protein LOC121375646 [Gigantopelta aegis]